ncbi:MAG: ImmA/IrrE family metallo-endopeptidase [Acidobacteria bacterium]|nr:ImmA/IrrE family metallo-endopeptidase [Acidobacteriota bacterium]
MIDYELPPGEKWRHFELQALGFRDFAGVRPGAPLDPFLLARFANLLVVSFDQIEGLTAEAREHLLGAGSEKWSGGACSRPLPDGRRIVILNPNHGRMRTNATLMEEISHVFLGHQPSRLKVVAENEGGRTISRDYRHSKFSLGPRASRPLKREARTSTTRSAHLPLMIVAIFLCPAPMCALRA